MIIELAELAPLLEDVKDCHVCRQGRAIWIGDSGRPGDWDVVTLHEPGCPAFIAPVRHLHAVGALTGGDAA